MREGNGFNKYDAQTFHAVDYLAALWQKPVA
jgi:hypothetical protein